MANDKHFSTEFPFYGEVSFDYENMTTDYDGMEHYFDDEGREIAAVVGESTDPDRSVTLYEYTADGLTIRETEYTESKGEDGYVAMQGDSWEKFGDQNGTFYLHTEVSESRTPDGETISSNRIEQLYGDSPYHEGIRELDSLSDKEGWSPDSDKIYDVVDSDISTTTDGDFAQAVSDHNFDTRVAEVNGDYPDGRDYWSDGGAFDTDDYPGTAIDYTTNDNGDVVERSVSAGNFEETTKYDENGRVESVYTYTEDDFSERFDDDEKDIHIEEARIEHFDYETKTIDVEIVAYEKTSVDCFTGETESIVYDKETDTFDYERRDSDGNLLEEYKCDIEGNRVDVDTEKDTDVKVDKEQNPDDEKTPDKDEKIDNDEENPDTEASPDEDYSDGDDNID